MFKKKDRMDNSIDFITYSIIDKIMLFMNDSLNVYLKYYLVVYILGYLLEKLISVLKNKIKQSKK